MLIFVSNWLKILVQKLSVICMDYIITIHVSKSLQNVKVLLCMDYNYSIHVPELFRKMSKYFFDHLCKCYVYLLTNILYLYINIFTARDKDIYFKTHMQWAPLAVNIFSNKIYMAEVDEISFFKIFKYITIKVLISNVECAIKIWYTLSILEWDVYIKIRKHVVKLLPIQIYFV